MSDSAGELRLRLEAGPEVMAALAARRESVTAAARRALSDSVMLVHRKITLNLTGAVLRVKTGRLRQSMQTFLSDDSGGVGTNVEYARIHELGGTIPPHEIRPRRGAALFFGGRFASRVMHPGATIPARPYMRPALEDSRDDIQKIFVSRLSAALKGKA